MQPYVDICFHDTSSGVCLCPGLPILEKEELFGILKLYADKQDTTSEVTNENIHVLITFDQSGSMGDICADRRTKMQHILHTLENMLRIFYSQKNKNISIFIQSFDDITYDIIDNVDNIRDCDLMNIIDKIHTVQPDGCTNIENALIKAFHHIQGFHTENPSHEIIHLFLTDGQITNGESNKQILKKYVSPLATNIFIGYGIEHDSTLLSHLGSGRQNEYRFIDALDKAGLVYGEILHDVLYPVFKNISLQLTGAEIYNYETNGWTNELYIGNLIHQKEKVFHIRRLDTLVQVSLYSNDSLIHSTVRSSLTESLFIYMLRQKSQELLYQANELLTNQDLVKEEDLDTDTDTEFNLNEYILSQNKETKEETEMKQRFKDFYTILMSVTDTYKEDPILKMIKDDIFISYKTLGTKYGSMFTSARQRSQGRQQTYSVSSLNDSTENSRLSNNSPFFPMSCLSKPKLTSSSNQYTPTLDNHILSPSFVTPYFTKDVLNTMRQVSGSYYPLSYSSSSSSSSPTSSSSSPFSLYSPSSPSSLPGLKIP
jgi:hypothetical protein